MNKKYIVWAGLLLVGALAGVAFAGYRDARAPAAVAAPVG